MSKNKFTKKASKKVSSYKKAKAQVEAPETVAVNLPVTHKVTTPEN